MVRVHDEQLQDGPEKQRIGALPFPLQLQAVPFPEPLAVRLQRLGHDPPDLRRLERAQEGHLPVGEPGRPGDGGAEDVDVPVDSPQREQLVQRGRVGDQLHGVDEHEHPLPDAAGREDADDGGVVVSGLGDGPGKRLEKEPQAAEDATNVGAVGSGGRVMEKHVFVSVDPRPFRHPAQARAFPPPLLSDETDAPGLAEPPFEAGDKRLVRHIPGGQRFQDFQVLEVVRVPVRRIEPFREHPVDAGPEAFVEGVLEFGQIGIGPRFVPGRDGRDQVPNPRGRARPLHDAPLHEKARIRRVARDENAGPHLQFCDAEPSGDVPSQSFLQFSRKGPNGGIRSDRAIPIPDDSDKERGAMEDFVDADLEDPAVARLFLRDPPSEIDLGHIDHPPPEFFAQPGKDTVDDDVPLRLHIGKGR